MPTHLVGARQSSAATLLLNDAEQVPSSWIWGRGGQTLDGLEHSGRLKLGPLSKEMAGRACKASAAGL
jgi:hypothetical protein